MLSLSYFVMFGSMQARMPMKNASRRDTRPWKEEEVYSPPLEKWITLILAKNSLSTQADYVSDRFFIK